MSIRSNVAISSSITAYARIHMMPFILHEGTVYTDTDSIFSKTPLDSSMIGSDIGLMKDELNGLVIKEAYFLDIKKYGYYYLDKFNNKIEKSVISGVERDSISFNEIKSIFNDGKQIIREIPSKFYKSFKYLNIKIQNSSITIKQTNHKLLINNKYYPININTPIIKDNIILKLIRQILTIINL